MEKNQNDKSTSHQEGMSKEKTNQDFNNQKPNPNDPIQNKNHQVGEDDGEENKKREVTSNTGNNPKEAPNRNEGAHHEGGHKEGAQHEDTHKEDSGHENNRHENDGINKPTASHKNELNEREDHKDVHYKSTQNSKNENREHHPDSSRDEDRNEKKRP